MVGTSAETSGAVALLSSAKQVYDLMLVLCKGSGSGESCMENNVVEYT